MYKEIGRLKNSTDLVEGNLRLVVHLAKSYQGMGLSLDELVNEGTIGLIKARDRFIEGKGKFSSYAALWIKAYIRQALNNKSRTIRMPAHLTGDSENAIKVSSLDPSYQGSYDPQTDADHNQTDAEHQLAAMFTKLKPKQVEIIKMKFGIGYDEEMKTIDIAKELGLTVQAVNGNIRNAMKLMKG